MDLIGSATSLEDIIDALAKRDCPNLTSSINLSTCSQRPLAGGGFCNVYRGTMGRGVEIAIKSLRVFDGPGKNSNKEKILKCAARELYYWSKLKHRNVLPLMGLAIYQGHMSMISEWMKNGDLVSYIKSNPDVNRIDLCMDICMGLKYIHTNNMVHGDLKAANVMVSLDGTAMIADFGNSQLKELTLKFTGTKEANFSVRWAAPELLDDEDSPHLSKEADVYAYGMTALETLTGKVPYEEFSERRVIFLVAVEHKIPDRPKISVRDELWGILLDCWALKQSERPTIMGVEDRLRQLVTSSTAMERRDTGQYMVDDLNANFPTTRGESGLMLLERLDSKRLLSMENLAAKYHNQGRLADAESLEVELLASRKQLLGNDHPDVFLSMANLAAIYYKQSRLADADSAETEALAGRRRVLGGQHPDTIHSMANLATIYHTQGRLAHAELLEDELLVVRRQNLGGYHPDTLRSMANLATTYYQRGRLADSELLEVELLAARKQAFGQTHPDTVLSMVNLATTYFKLGKLVDARLLQTQVIAIRTKLLGEDHSDTQKSIHTLALMSYAGEK